MKASQGKSKHFQRQEKFRKTKMCTFYEAGRCNRGEFCCYAHSTCELQPQPDLHKSELCAQFSFTGSCDRGETCRFAHGSKELRQTSLHQASLRQTGSDISTARNTSGQQPVFICLKPPFMEFWARAHMWDKEQQEAWQRLTDTTV